MAIESLSLDTHTFAGALRLTELMAGVALAVHSLEHLLSHGAERRERLIFSLRGVLAVLLAQGEFAAITSLLLLGTAILTLHRFQGPYNGGSDRLGILILICLTIAHWAPTPYWQAVGFGYLGAQVTLSYFMAGWVKITNPQWHSSHALQDVFAWSAYPVGESLRGWAHHPRLLWCAAWGVMLLELAFPLALLHPSLLKVALLLTASFHLANACLFGLNRFFWIWIASYPALLWLQARLPM